MPVPYPQKSGPLRQGTDRRDYQTCRPAAPLSAHRRLRQASCRIADKTPGWSGAMSATPTADPRAPSTERYPPQTLPMPPSTRRYVSGRYRTSTDAPVPHRLPGSVSVRINTRLKSVSPFSHPRLYEEQGKESSGLPVTTSPSRFLRQPQRPR